MISTFNLYSRISTLAREVYSGKNVSVSALMVGDEYTVTVDHREVLRGKAMDVFAELDSMIYHRKEA